MCALLDRWKCDEILQLHIRIGCAEEQVSANMEQLHRSLNLWRLPRSVGKITVFSWCPRPHVEVRKE